MKETVSELHPITEELPLGKASAMIAKKYVGVIRNQLKHLGIDRHFYPLLMIYRNNGKISQKELSSMMTCDKVTMVRILDYLSDNKLIARKVNPDDRREHLLVLTEKGNKIAPEISRTFKNINKKAFQGIQKKDLETVLSGMNKILSNLNELPSDEVSLSFGKR